jgi:HPt (histidine-containing phosphotransfer) domain-containing protein
MDDYIPKPVDFVNLYRLLRRYLPTQTDPAAALRRRAPLTSQEAQRLLQAFAERSRALLAALKQAVADGDPREVYRITHNLRGAAANLGLDRIAELAGQIEPSDQDSSQTRMGSLEREIARLRDSLAMKGIDGTSSHEEKT